MKRNTSHNIFSPGRLATVLPLLLLAGCVSQPQKLQQREPADPTPGTTVTRNVQPVSPDEYARTPEVVRYDRYLLVSTDPQAAQRDPLSQIIDIRIPSSLHPTVADALRYALRQSGYSLCATGSANGVLYRQALPASSTSWARCACVLPCRSWPVRPGSLRWMMYSVWSATACATATSCRSPSFRRRSAPGPRLRRPPCHNRPSAPLSQYPLNLSAEGF